MTKILLATPGIVAPTVSTPSDLQLVGHSYMDSRGIGISNTPGNFYSSAARIAALFGVQAGQVQNLSVSGAAMRTQTSNGAARYLSLINPGSATPWPPVSKAGVICSMFGTNDLILGVQSLVQKGLVQGYRAVISRYRAAAVWDYNDATTVQANGSWTPVLYSTVSPAWGSGSGCIGTTTVTDNIVITPPATITQDGQTRIVTVGFVTGTTGGTATVAVDGVTAGVIDTSGACFDSTERGAHCIRVPFGPTNTTITVTVTAITGGGPFYFDYWSVESDRPPLFLIGEITCPPNPPPLWSLNTPANVATANGWLQALVTEFNDPTVRFALMDTALGGLVIRANGQGTTPSNFVFYEHGIGPTFYGLHPNDKGAQIVASSFVQEAREAVLTGALDPSQIVGYNSAEQPPLTAFQAEIFHGAGTALTLLDGFGGADQNTTPTNWTPIMGGWGVYQKQLAVVNDQFAYPTFQDSFNRANGAPGSAYTVASGTWAIVADELANTGVAGGGVLPMILANQQLDVSGNGAVHGVVGTVREDFSGIIFRRQDASNFWRLYMSVTFTSWVLVKRIAGVDTVVQNGSLGSNATGQALHVELNGTSIKVYNNGALVKSVTDAALQTARGCGLTAFSTFAAGPTWDVFQVRAGAMDTTGDALGFNAIVRDVGFSDGAFSFVAGASGPVNFGGNVFRYVDVNNYLTLYQSATFGGWALYSVIAGVQTHVCDCHESNAAGTVVGCQMAGNVITLYFNGVAAGAGPQTIASCPQGTKLGARLDYQSTVASTIPNQVMDTVETGGSVAQVPDTGYYRDDSTGIMYGPYLTGVPTDQIAWLPTKYGVDAASAIPSLRKGGLRAQNGQAAIWTPTTLGWTFTNSGITAQRLYMNRFVVETSDPIVRLGFYLAVADSSNDPVMVAILDTTGKVLAVSASTLAKVNAGAPSIQGVPCAFTPTPGVPYFACFLGTAVAWGSTPQMATATIGPSNGYAGLFGTGYAQADCLKLDAQSTIPAVGTTLGAPTGTISGSVAILLMYS